MTERAWEKHAWILLFAVAVVFALFGIGDVVLGTAADPAIVVGITGMTPEEIGEIDPALLTLLNQAVRAGGAAILVAGLLAAAVAATAFRRRERWAWYALWTLPLWMVIIFVIMLVSRDPATGVLPPPLLSAPVFLAIAVAGLLLPVRRFFPGSG